MFSVSVGTLPEIMKEARLLRGLSQDEFGALLGVNGQTVSNLETGKTRCMKMLGMRKLAEITGKSVAELMTAPDADPAPEVVRDAAIETFDAMPPEWELAVAAGDWIDSCVNGHLDTDNPEQRQILKQGLFIIKIRGDSMQPRLARLGPVAFSLMVSSNSSATANPQKRRRTLRTAQRSRLGLAALWRSS